MFVSGSALVASAPVVGLSIATDCFFFELHVFHLDGGTGSSTWLPVVDVLSVCAHICLHLPNVLLSNPAEKRSMLSKLCVVEFI